MKNKLINLIKSILVTYTLSFSIFSYYSKNYNELFNIDILFINLIIIIFFILFSKEKNKSNIWINILSIIFSLIYIFGYSYMKTSSAILVFGSVDLFLLSFVSAIGYFIIFNYLLKKIFGLFESSFFTENINLGKFSKCFEDHPFLSSISIIIICWLIYIIAFYPAILTPDSSFEIRQFFGIWTKYNEYSVMLDENVLITNHHPVIYTLFLGSCLNFGNFIGNDNFGLFLCSLIQIICLSSTFAYSIMYLKKIEVSNKMRFIVLLIYALCPMFPMYAMTLVKDVIFGCFIMLFIIFLHKFIKNYKFNYIIFMLIIIGVFLFRNNGYHVLIFAFILMGVFNRKKWRLPLVSLIFVVVLSICYNDIILPYFKITPGSVREILSVPFQQTARYYRDHKEDMSLSDIEIVDKILDISDLDIRYKEEISDPVKNKFNKYATNDDLKAYFKVWFKGLLKHPTTYIDATINNTYGYFYPEKTNWYVYYKFDSRIVDNGFDYHYNNLSGIRNVLSSIAVSIPSIPIIGLISNIGFNVWCLFIMLVYLFYKKKYSSVILLLPSFGLLLVCILSPVNCYFRYALPYVFAMPFMFSLFIDLIKGEIYEKRNRE